jgi:hypothetical protein
MPIVLSKFAIAYYPTPKVASTSIKMVLYEIEHGTRWVNYQDDGGQWWHIHNAWMKDEPTPFHVLPDDASLFKFAVIRDPIERFLSAFGNRVHHHQELSERILSASPDTASLGLLPNPDLETFIERLDDYCAVSVSIHHHVRPQTDFIGTSLDYFDEIYKFTEITRIAENLSEIVDHAVDMPHEQQKGLKLDPANVSSQHIETLTSFYKQDYDVFGHLYPSRAAG